MTSKEYPIGTNGTGKKNKGVCVYQLKNSGEAQARDKKVTLTKKQFEQMDAINPHAHRSPKWVENNAPYAKEDFYRHVSNKKAPKVDIEAILSQEEELWNS